MQLISTYRTSIFACLALVVAQTTTHAAYVMPMIGGGQVGMMGAPMIHTDIGFDGTNITATQDTSHGVPMLRPLTAPDEFDPTQAWSVLQNKAYNFQHAWNPAGFITLPGGAGIWIERISQDAELESYKRAPATPAYAPVFSADGDRWQWSGAMTHNVYAVLNPTKTDYAATYKVYIGDASTGDPLSAYGSATVTWSWNAVVVPEPTGLGALAITMLVRRRRQA